MRSLRFFLSIKYTPANTSGGVKKAVGGLLRYLQYRDQHQEEQPPRDVQGLLRYVAWRDVAPPQGRLFNEAGMAGDRERKELGDYIARSVAGLDRAPQSNWPPQRAYYGMVFSPEDARGLDLRQLTKEAMAQLERDLGGKLPPWIGAEHRNTAHPHVHIVLGARRELAPGQYRAMMITRPRLARIKLAIGREMARQRGERVIERDTWIRQLERPALEEGRPTADFRQLAQARARRTHATHRLGRFTGSIARRYLREAERIASQRLQLLERERER